MNTKRSAMRGFVKTLQQLRRKKKEQLTSRKLLKTVERSEIIEKADDAEIIEDEAEETAIVGDEIVEDENDESVIDGEEAEIIAEKKEVEDDAEDKTENKPKLEIRCLDAPQIEAGSEKARRDCLGRTTQVRQTSGF